MMLLERDQVDTLLEMGGWADPFYIDWDLNDPVQFAEATRVDFANILSEGPFLLTVNDEIAWAGSDRGLYRVAEKRHGSMKRRQWRYLVDIYAEGMGISGEALVPRYTSMRRQTYSKFGEWLPWSEVYHWPQGGELAWSAIEEKRHPALETREYEGQRQVRCAR